MAQSPQTDTGGTFVENDHSLQIRLVSAYVPFPLQPQDDARSTTWLCVTLNWYESLFLNKPIMLCYSYLALSLHFTIDTIDIVIYVIMSSHCLIWWQQTTHLYYLLNYISSHRLSLFPNRRAVTLKQRSLAYQQCTQPNLSCTPVVHSTVIKSRSPFSPNQSLWAFKGRRSISYNCCIPGGAPVSDPGFIWTPNPQSNHLDYNNSLRD